MEKDKTYENLEKLIKYIELALDSIENKKDVIISELIRWKSEIDIDEARESLQLILEKVTRWFDNYKENNDILCISLKEYDVVAKEAAYILGETALVDDLYSEIIDWLVGCIGAKMCDELNEEGKIGTEEIDDESIDFNVDNPTKENIKYTFNKLLLNLNAAYISSSYSNNKYKQIIKYVKKWSSIYSKNNSLIQINHKDLLNVYYQLQELRYQGYYAKMANRWQWRLMLLRKAQINNREHR